MIIPDQSEQSNETSNPQQGRAGVVVLSVLVGIEALFLLVATGWMLSRFFVEVANDVAGAALLTAVTAVIAAWLTWTCGATFQEKPWVRGSIVTWQILQVSVAVGIFQGLFSQPGLTGEINLPTLVMAWVLLVLGILCAALIFFPGVNKRLRRKD